MPLPAVVIGMSVQSIYHTCYRISITIEIDDAHGKMGSLFEVVEITPIEAVGWRDFPPGLCNSNKYSDQTGFYFLLHFDYSTIRIYSSVAIAVIVSPLLLFLLLMSDKAHILFIKNFMWLSELFSRNIKKMYQFIDCVGMCGRAGVCMFR